MSIWDKWSKGSRDNVGKYAWAIVLAVLKEAGEVALAEFGAALEQYRKERKTPDGWTEEEYLTYAIGRLRLVQAKELGPWVVDEVIDYCIERLIDVLEGKLDKLDDDPVDDDDVDLPPLPVQPPTPAPEPVPVPEPVPPPVEPPAPVEPPTPKPAPKDPYYPTKYGPMDDLPRHRLYKNDQVWKEGLDRFIIPRLFTELPIYRQATNGATLIEIINDSGVDAV